MQRRIVRANPEDPETFPDGLLDAIDDPELVITIQRHRADHSVEGRLKAKMQTDALRPLKSSLYDVDAPDDSATEQAELRTSPYSEEDLQEVIQFLRLGVSTRSPSQVSDIVADRRARPSTMLR